MAIITEDYVSFETAKLLKDKGYKGLFNSYYNDAGCIVDRPNILLKEPEYQYYERVSLQMAMKWLREVHQIDIQVFRHIRGKRITFYARIEQNTHLEHQDKCNLYLSYEEACEVAIKYCLENLIK